MTITGGILFVRNEPMCKFISCISLFYVASCKKKYNKKKKKKKKKIIQEQHFSVSVAWSKLKKKYTKENFATLII